MNKIAEFRKQLGITQAQLADRIGWKQPRIANYEVGNRIPNIPTAQAIVNGLQSFGANVRLEDVFPIEN